MKYDKTNKCFVETKTFSTKYVINDLSTLKDWIYGTSRIFNLKELAKFKKDVELACNKLKISKIERQNFRNYFSQREQGFKNVEIANKKYKELK